MALYRIIHALKKSVNIFPLVENVYFMICLFFSVYFSTHWLSPLCLFCFCGGGGCWFLSVFLHNFAILNIIEHYLLDTH